MKRKIYLTFALSLLSLSLCICANAQKEKSFKGVNWKKMVEAAKRGKVSIDQSIITRVEEAYAEKKVASGSRSSGADLTGTWFMTVPGETPEATFYAYHTFGADGTLVETSSALVTLTEGPAHGVWERRQHGFVVTFELFAFEPENEAYIGRFRVRNFIRLVDRNNLRADAVVDIIELDGTVIPNIATAFYTGQRVQVREL